MTKKVLHWLDNNILQLLAGFLLVFIPLYPKWPLFDILYGYNVRVRLEDFFVAGTLVVFIVQWIRKKVVLPQTPVSKGLFTYLFFGFLSVLVSIFVIKTVPLEYLHAGKTFLHWLRRVEYFSLFFIFFSSIKSNKAIKVYLWLFFLTFLAVVLYGYGQKYLYWPAFSTMNREFAKGWWLYLTEHARVLSTFGGHYDLAGYLVIALTLSWSFFIGLKNKLLKTGLGLLILSGFWLLILTASRISFISYLLGLSVVIFIWTFKKGLGWGVSRWLVATFLSVLLMLSFGDLSDRFLRLVKISDRVSGLKQILLKPTASPPQNNAMFLENNLAAVAAKSDVPPTPIKPGDVTGQEMPLLLPVKTATGTALVQTPRTYSQNALLYDLSTGIRLDATWPRAWAGFLRDPILGSGYATLTKTTIEEFTEGESTDNDYLRALGETGFLGFATFFGTIILMAILVFRSLGGINDPILYSLSAGFIGLSFGLLTNGLLIDIFEASKVAYVFWGISGLSLGAIYLNKSRIEANYQPMRIEFSWSNFTARAKKFFTSDFFWVAVVAVLTLLLRTNKLDTPLADWHSWRQADTSAVTRNFLKSDRINWLYPVFDDLSSIPSGKPNPMGYRFVEFPIYNAASVLVKKIFVDDVSVEGAGRLTTGLFSVSAMIFLFLLCRRFISRRVAYFSALAFSTIPYSIYYGRTILPDPAMVATSLGALWFTSKYGETRKKRYFVIGLLFAAAALLIKPFAIFLLAPIVYVWWVNFGVNLRKFIVLLVFWSIGLLPLLLWRYWIGHFPEGIPANDWLFNGDGIRFKGAFWFWLFADRIGRLILGYWGLIPFGFGLVRKLEGKYRLFPILFLLSSILYLFVFATGNVRHDYYQILLLPSLSLFVGIGLDTLLSGNLMAKLLAVVSSIFMLSFGWYFVRDYYNINHPEIVAAGKDVEKLTHDKSLVIAPYDGDTAFLYQTNRRGWPIVENNIDYMIKNGAQYYVSVRLDDKDTKKLLADAEAWDQVKIGLPRKKYNLVKLTDSYVIIQIVPNDKLPK